MISFCLRHPMWQKRWHGGVFVPPEKCRERFGGLFGVFADSLPDSWGQLLLERHLASIGIDRCDVSTLDRLAFIGRSGMGALEQHLIPRTTLSDILLYIDGSQSQTAFPRSCPATRAL